MIETVATNNDRLFAFVEPVEKLAHLLEPICLRQLLLVFVGPTIYFGVQNFGIRSAEPFVVAMLIKNCS